MVFQINHIKRVGFLEGDQVEFVACKTHRVNVFANFAQLFRMLIVGQLSKGREQLSLLFEDGQAVVVLSPVRAAADHAQFVVDLAHVRAGLVAPAQGAADLTAGAVTEQTVVEAEFVQAGVAAVVGVVVGRIGQVEGVIGEIKSLALTGDATYLRGGIDLIQIDRQ